MGWWDLFFNYFIMWMRTAVVIMEEVGRWRRRRRRRMIF
jgi:hypothetical protein